MSSGMVSADTCWSFEWILFWCLSFDFFCWKQVTWKNSHLSLCSLAPCRTRTSLTILVWSPLLGMRLPQALVCGFAFVLLFSKHVVLLWGSPPSFSVLSVVFSSATFHHLSLGDTFEQATNSSGTVYSVCFTLCSWEGTRTGSLRLCQTGRGGHVKCDQMSCYLEQSFLLLEHLLACLLSIFQLPSTVLWRYFHQPLIVHLCFYEETFKSLQVPSAPCTWQCHSLDILKFLLTYNLQKYKNLSKCICLKQD